MVIHARVTIVRRGTLCLIHANADDIIMVTVDDHLIGLAPAVSERCSTPPARGLVLDAELPLFDLLTSPST
jgi:hypothetical protein